MAARRQIPAQENTFRRLYLNQWTDRRRWLSLGVGRVPRRGAGARRAVWYVGDGPLRATDDRAGRRLARS